MKLNAIKKFIPPLGPLFSLILIGLLLLSAIIYYRAVRSSGSWNLPLPSRSRG